MTETPGQDKNSDVDALSDVLRVAHLTGGVFLHADFFAPWCMAARVSPEHCMPALGPASHLIIYHYVIEGEFRIRVDGGGPKDVVIGAGEVVLLPRNDLHLMGSDLSLPPVAGIDIIHPPKDGDRGQRLDDACATTPIFSNIDEPAGCRMFSGSTTWPLPRMTPKRPARRRSGSSSALAPSCHSFDGVLQGPLKHFPL